MTTASHRLRDVVFSWAGITAPPESFGDDDVIKLAHNPAFSVTEGAGGGTCVNQLTPNPLVVVELKVLATHPINDLLSAAYVLSMTGPAGIGVAPLMVSDSNGNQLLVDSGTVLEGLPAEVSFGPTVKYNVWRFLGTQAVSFVGGH